MLDLTLQVRSPLVLQSLWRCSFVCDQISATTFSFLELFHLPMPFHLTTGPFQGLAQVFHVDSCVLSARES